MREERSIVGGLGDGEVERERRFSEGRWIIDDVGRLRECGVELFEIGVGAVRRGELGGHAFDGRLGAERFFGVDARELKLDREGVREVIEVAFRDAGAATGALADLDDSDRRQSSERIPYGDPADAELVGELVLGAEEVSGLQAAVEDRVPNLLDDTARKGGTSGRQDSINKGSAHKGFPQK